MQYLGGDTDPNAIKARAVELGKNPDTEYARVLSEGFFTEIQNEKGKNAEIGVKVALNDDKLVGTMSVYRVTRENRNVDNTQKQFDEPLNYNAAGTSSRVLRWFSASALQETEGVEFEGVWTPIRAFQSRITGGWMWKAETIADPSLNILPNSSAAAKATREIVFNSRLAYAPEYTFRMFNKYTFMNNFVGEHGRGASIGLGIRYSSEIIIGADQNFNASRGGITAGDYVVLQTVFSYPFEVMGYNMSATINVENLFDEKYSEGNFNLANPRTYTLTMGMTF